MNVTRLAIVSISLLILATGCSSLKKPQAVVPSPTPTPQANTVVATSQESVPVVSKTTEPSKSEIFEQAIDKATGASAIAQSATSSDDRKLAASLWQDAIDLLKTIPATSPNYGKAKKKISEYQGKLAVAKKNINNPPQFAISDTQTTYQLTSNTVEAPAPSARDFLEDYLNYITTKGGTGSGTAYFCKETEELASSLFSPRSYQILDISEFPGEGGVSHASATVRIDSSNKGGSQITADWSFYMKKGPGIIQGLPGGWCMKLINDK